MNQPISLATWHVNVVNADLEFSRLESWSRDPFYKSCSRSWSWSWNLRVLVLVLGLATMKTRFSSLMKREIVRLSPLLLWNGYLATVVC